LGANLPLARFDEPNAGWLDSPMIEPDFEKLRLTAVTHNVVAFLIMPVFPMKAGSGPLQPEGPRLDRAGRERR
jgi:hypothetical protein